jgi:type IV secretory pathway TraG/TraD family ATPase VirD4
LDRKFEYLAEKDPSCFAVSCWRSFQQLPIRTASCVFGTLNTTIDTIFSPELRKLIAMEKRVDFEKMATQKTILFVSTSAVNPALHCFINIFYAQAFKSLFEYAEGLPSGKLPIPVHVLCDDFATGSRILNFPEYISIFREKQISVTLLVQSESQLESMYGCEDATTIINNCDTYLYMGGMDLKTGRSISERLNAPLEDILYMPIGQVYIFRRGQKPITTVRYDILQDKQFQEVTRAYEERIRENEH